MNYFKTIKELASLLEGYSEVVESYKELIDEIYNISSEEIVCELIRSKINIEER